MLPLKPAPDPPCACPALSKTPLSTEAVCVEVNHEFVGTLAKGLSLSVSHNPDVSAIYLNVSLIKLNAFSMPWVEFKTTLAGTSVSTSPTNSGKSLTVPVKLAKIAAATVISFVAYYCCAKLLVV